jgi:putative tricarboxylic transport membrane protein
VRSSLLTGETWVSAALIAVGAAMAWGARDIPSEAGYGGVGANFLPWVVALALMACGTVLLWQARTGGYRDMDDVDDADDVGDVEVAAGDGRADWPGFVWVSAGLLLNAASIERLGFVLSCALTYVLAVRGLKRAHGQQRGGWLLDVITGVLLAMPVYWLFTRLLAINLPSLTATGWL